MEESISLNPATGEVIKTYLHLSNQEIESKIIAAHKQYKQWCTIPLSSRIEYMVRLGKLLREQTNKYAQLITLEMGKPIKQAEAEIIKCAWLCEHYAENAAQYLSPRFIKTEMKKSYVAYHPLGVILGVMPWNFPFWQVMRFAVPSVLAGNTCLLKHAANVSGCSLAIESVFRDAGFPAGTFTSLIIGADQVAQVIANPLVAAASLTGSERAGKQIATEAGAVLKKVVLELGGSDPYIVLADADLDKAAEAIINSRLGNAGQSCIAAKRILIVNEVYLALQERIVNMAKKYQYGDPLSPDTKLGPVARQDLRETLHQQVMNTIAAGAKLLCGGSIPQGKGFYYPATVLADIPLTSPANCEELFGPVISLFSVKDYKEAIEIANNSTYGLSSGIFTRDIELAERIAAELQAGSVTINLQTISDPRLPFGGIKNSGHGRELSEEGIREFTNVKTICVV